MSSNSYIETYRAEADEHLTDMEEALLQLEQRPHDMELVGRIFRALHTIKGSGAMFGFDRVAAFTHEVEMAFDLVRNGRLAVTQDLINLALASKDVIVSLLAHHGTDADPGDQATMRVLDGLRRIVPSTETPQGASEDKARESDTPGNANAVLYHVRFRPGGHVFEMGISPIMILEDLVGLAERMAVVTHAGDLPDMDKAAPEESYLWWDALLTSQAGEAAIRDVFIFVEDVAEIGISRIGPGAGIDQEALDRAASALLERPGTSADELATLLGISAPDDDPHAPSPTPSSASQGQASSTLGGGATIRVDAAKLDALMALVGELVTVQARLTRSTFDWGDFDLVVDNSEIIERLMRHDFQELKDLFSIAEELERITNRIRDNTMSIRMVPIGSVFGKFKRLVRDLSGELGKDVRLETSGGETELDKTIIDRLGDPLVHLIRNSIDHGVEPPEEREAAGKPQEAVVSLLAEHVGAHVRITIEDDGRGLDMGRILGRAIELGLAQADTPASERETLQLIFAPGFSTAREVTSVSGRGVGMDVVKKTIEGMRGSVEIGAREGGGTRVSLMIPLTLAIIDGLLVRISDHQFVLPLSQVLECIEMSREDARGSITGDLLHVRGQTVPYIRLREAFGMEDQLPEFQYVVVAEVAGGKVGFLVDSVVGEHQTVIKPLGRMYRNLRGASGATILGDGRVALILDLQKLYEDALTRQAQIA